MPAIRFKRSPNRRLRLRYRPEKMRSYFEAAERVFYPHSEPSEVVIVHSFCLIQGALAGLFRRDTTVRVQLGDALIALVRQTELGG